MNDFVVVEMTMSVTVDFDRYVIKNPSCIPIGVLNVPRELVHLEEGVSLIKFGECKDRVHCIIAPSGNYLSILKEGLMGGLYQRLRELNT